MPRVTGGCRLNRTPSKVGLKVNSNSGSSPGGRGSSSALISSAEISSGACLVTTMGNLDMLIRIPLVESAGLVMFLESSCTLPSMELSTVVDVVSIVARTGSSSAVIIGSSSENKRNTSYLEVISTKFL